MSFDADARSARRGKFQGQPLPAGQRILRTGAFFRTSGPPIAIPADSLVSRQDMIVDGRAGITLPTGGWFPEAVREMTIFAEQYDFAVTLLLLEDRHVCVPKNQILQYW
jgi:hypothetical protein